MSAPLIQTRMNDEEPGGRRRPAPACVSGQVAERLRESGATVASVADGPDLPPDLVEAAARHAAAHPDAMARDRDDAAAWRRYGGPPAGQ